LKVRTVFFGLFLLNFLGIWATGYAATPTLQRVKDIKTIQVLVQQTFGEAGPISLPFYRDAKRNLEDRGFRVVDAKATKFDAQLIITAEGMATTGTYSGGLQYSGAQVSGNLVLSRNGTSLWTGNFEGDIPPAQVILKKYRRPSDAPFEKAFDETGFDLLIYSMAYFLGDDPSLKEVTDALSDRRTVIRSKALEILGVLKVPQTLPVVLDRLKDTDPVVRLNALKTLGLYEQGETVASVVAALNDESIDVRREAVRLLGKFRDSRAVPSLIRLLKNDAFIQISVRDSLLKIGEPSVEPLITLLAEENVNPLAREEAVEVLGELKDPRAIPPLLHSLESTDRWEQRNAVEALCQIGVDAVGQLFVAAKDNNPVLRRNAVEVLGKLRATSAMSVLSESLADPDSTVRTQAAWALGELGDNSVMDFLEKLALNDPDENVREAAGEAIEKIRRHTNSQS
jgi:HEAT repeat protein